METHPTNAHRPAPATPAPVGAADRIRSLDAVRGLALLGIFFINLPFFAFPIDFMTYEASIASTPGNDRAMWIVEVLGQGKFMALFAMLFGTGAVLYARKYDAETGPDGSPAPLARGAGLWYRRLGILAAIGFCHALFVWFGDILLPYAITGMMVVWWVRRLPVWALTVLAVASYAVGLALTLGLTIVGMQFSNGVEMEGFAVQDQIEAFGAPGSYAGILLINGFVIIQNTIFVPLMFGWMLAGLMMGGIALFRAGFFSAQWSVRAYLLTILIGATTSLPATIALHAWTETAAYGRLIYFFGAQPVGIPLSLAYASVIILLVKAGALAWLTGALANVGRMALTNYLMQSLITVLLFYFYGFGLYNSVNYPELWLVVAGVWLVNLGFSSLWMRRFSMGPMEWVWRTLTYGRRPNAPSTAPPR